jgi:ergothioneine biosynthesis glutamate--cysteine ligase EgtA
MSARQSASRTRPELREPASPLTLDAAYEYVSDRALVPGPVGRVGLELEGHLVDLAAPDRLPSWNRIQAAVADLERLPGRSAVTQEPGGQLELSTPALPNAVSAIAALRADEAAMVATLAEHGLGVAEVGTDLARRPVRVNPKPRYQAMEAYFSSTGFGTCGRAMMCSTASLQVNLEAGPASRWSERIQLAHRLGPVLVAISASSPVLAGEITGWRSTRQRVWGELDQARCGPLLAGTEPSLEWADYAMHAPVMLVLDPVTGGATPMMAPISFADWAAGRVHLAGRSPTEDDLAYHLTTLFPPVRLRGFVEIRYLDSVPRQWWPALAAIVTTLLDDPLAADTAAEATERTVGQWTEAARVGLDDPTLARAARRCVAAALDAVPADSRPGVERYAQLVESGRSPGDDVLDRVLGTDPTTVFGELAHA